MIIVFFLSRLVSSLYGALDEGLSGVLVPSSEELHVLLCCSRGVAGWYWV